MGTYLYTLRGSKIKVKGVPLEEPVFGFVYACKPLLGETHSKEASAVRTALGVLERNKPRFAAVATLDEKRCVRFIEHATVYWLESPAESWYDSSPFPGKAIGFLKKTSTGWVMVRDTGWILECGKAVRYQIDGMVSGRIRTETRPDPVV